MTQQFKEFSIRKGTLADLDIVMRHRRQMFIDMGYRDESALAATQTTSKPFFAERMKNQTYHAWFVEDAARNVVAGGGVVIFDYHSNPTDPLPKRPMVVNVYTEPSFRRRGIARALMNVIVDWCREYGFGTIILHASDEGRPLYESLGFMPTGEMRLLLH